MSSQCHWIVVQDDGYNFSFTLCTIIVLVRQIVHHWRLFRGFSASYLHPIDRKHRTIQFEKGIEPFHWACQRTIVIRCSFWRFFSLFLFNAFVGDKPPTFKVTQHLETLYTNSCSHSSKWELLKGSTCLAWHRSAWDQSSIKAEVVRGSGLFG